MILSVAPRSSFADYSQGGVSRILVPRLSRSHQVAPGSNFANSSQGGVIRILVSQLSCFHQVALLRSMFCLYPTGSAKYPLGRLPLVLYGFSGCTHSCVAPGQFRRHFPLLSCRTCGIGKDKEQLMPVVVVALSLWEIRRRILAAIRSLRVSLLLHWIPCIVFLLLALTATF